MGKFLFHCIALSLLLINFQSHAEINSDKYNWKLIKDRADIQIYTAKVPDSKHKAVRASMIIDARAESVAAMLMDLDNCDQWAPLCKEAYVQERISDTENFVYSLNNVPFPGVDRDAVTHVSWSRENLSGVILMESYAVEGRVPKVKGVIRIKYAIATWRLTPQEDGLLLVESFAHVNPASSMPKWLLNNLLIGSPYKTMKNIRHLMGEGLYKDATLSF